MTSSEVDDLHTLSINAGLRNLKNPGPYAVSLKAERVILHPDYSDAITGGDDIAVIILNETMPYSELIQPACLPSKIGVELPKSSICYMVGWGATNTRSKCH